MEPDSAVCWTAELESVDRTKTRNVVTFTRYVRLRTSGDQIAIERRGPLA
jgi:hypothetical protein